MLRGADIDFTIDTENDFEEICPDGISPEEVPAFLARGKSYGFHRPLTDDELLITADTVVIVDGQVLGKPHSHKQAEEMLNALSGREHEVRTAVMLRSKDKEKLFTDVTKVLFCELSSEEIEYYIEKYKPFDKAGAYGVQGQGALLVERIDGDFFNVMGLPVLLLSRMLAEFGVTLL